MLRRWDPFAQLARMDDAFGRVWSERSATRPLPIDVTRSGDEMVIRASVPGVAPEDLEVSVDRGVLTIAGGTDSELDDQSASYLLRERVSGRFSRSVRLPEGVDAERAETTYDRGVVTVSLPASESARRRRLEVRVAD